MNRKTLTAFLDDYLHVREFDDGTYNGLQIEGKSQIRKVGFAVDSSLESYLTAVEKGCDLLIVHHGLIWGGLSHITGMMKERLSVLIKNDVNLYVCHLPLDAHPEYGNNARIIQALGAKPVAPFVDVGFIAEFDDPIDFEELSARVRDQINPEIRMMPYGEKKISRIAVSSGGFRASWLNAAISARADAVLTGEGASESLFYHTCREEKMNVIFAGHYATETFGLEGLKEVLEKQFDSEKIDWEMLSLPTGW